MKIVCLVMDMNDLNWLAEYWIKKPANTEVVVVAFTFEGKRAAESLRIPYRTHEEVLWGIDINAIYDRAREQSYNWFNIPDIKNNVAVRSIANFNGYPLLAMHQSRLLMSLFEIIYAFEFMARIIEIERPDNVLFGDRENPFAKHVLFMMTGSNGVEREVAKSLGLGFINDSSIIAARLASLAPSRQTVDRSSHNPDSFSWPSGSNGPKVLIFHYGGYYYLEFLLETLKALHLKGTQLGIINIGQPLTSFEEEQLRQLGACCVDKSAWRQPGESLALSEWQKSCERAALSVYSSTSLQRYFSTERGSYFQGLASDALCKEILNTGHTVVELMRTEAILRDLRPDMVVNPFATHPDEVCDVLPARKLGIPTLTMGHGIDGYSSAIRDPYSTDVYAVNGQCFKDALIQAVGASPENVVIVGNLRHAKRPELCDPKVIKGKLRLNPAAPLCIVCDNSVIPVTIELRYKTDRVIEEVLVLKRQIPELQIIYRVHHGGDYSHIQRYVKQFRHLGIIFQTSLDVQLLDIVQAADVVIANFSSAIGESLLSGIPVIYLHALAVAEPSYFGCPAILTADSYEKLPGLVRKLLDNPRSQEDIRRMAQPYFDYVLHGNDGKAHERLADLITRMATTPRNECKPGFQDWLDRIEASCTFRSKEFNKSTRPNPTSGSTGVPMKLPEDYEGHNLVFIVGCPRSGTTWLQRLLACHPAVRTGQESDVFDLFVGPQLRNWRTFLNTELSGRPVGLGAYFREEEYLPILKRYMLDLLRPLVGNLQAGELFVEKTPSHALFIPEIMELLPKSRIIHVLRDPRDVVCSLMAASKGWGSQWAPRDARSAAQMWVEHVLAARSSASLLPRNRFYEIRYEEMGAQVKLKLKDIVGFLGLRWDETGIRAAVEKNRFETAKKTGGGTTIKVGGELGLKGGPATREPEGFFRKGCAGAWREDLRGEDLAHIAHVAGKIMLEMGYSMEDPQAGPHAGNHTGGHPTALPSTASTSHSLAQDLLMKGRSDEASSVIERALLSTPDSIELLTLKAQLKLQTGNVGEAKSILLKVLRRMPANPAALNQLAVVAYSEGDAVGAMEILKDVLIIDPNNETAHLNASLFRRGAPVTGQMLQI